MHNNAISHVAIIYSLIYSIHFIITACSVVNTIQFFQQSPSLQINWEVKTGNHTFSKPKYETCCYCLDLCKMKFGNAQHISLVWYSPLSVLPYLFFKTIVCVKITLIMRRIHEETNNSRDIWSNDKERATLKSHSYIPS